MKFTIYDWRLTIAAPRPPARAASAAATPRSPIANRQSPIANRRAFTLIEIAICLAIISFALIAIIGVLPLGMDTQRQIREETAINQDATMLMEAIRSGNQYGGGTDLAKYVYNIQVGGTNYGLSVLTNSQMIVGLLSTPGGVHNVASVHSMSGLAAQESPQDNTTIMDDAFSYEVVCVNVPVQGVNNVLQNNLWELRMTFLWPILPNGKIGTGRQTFRALIAGQLTVVTNNTPWLYFYQPQTFQ